MDLRAGVMELLIVKFVFACNKKLFFQLKDKTLVSIKEYENTDNKRLKNNKNKKKPRNNKENNINN